MANVAHSTLTGADLHVPKAHTLDSTTYHSAATDNTDHDASTTKHGLCPKLPNDANKFLNGIGGWTAASGGFTWAQKTANYTAADLDGILADTATTAAFTVTLPASPSGGEQVAILDAASNFETDNLTIGRNGENINGAAADYTFDEDETGAVFVYDAATGWWVWPKMPPVAHAASHEPAGGDAMAVDAAAGTGSLRTLGTGAAQAAAGNDVRLEDARTPLAHADAHTDGTDDIQSATAAQKGVATAAQITKLDGIEALADVTDATNVAAAGAVMDTGNETVAGIKTFSSFPVTPSAAPTTDYQAANKKYVDDAGGGGGLYSDYIMVSDQKTANTHGGTFTSGAWRTRDITTEDADTGGDCSISSNQITLATGTYRCLIRAPGNDVDRHVIRLRNTSDGATTLVGSAVNASSSANVYNDSILQGRFTIAAQKTFEVQHYSETSHATNGFGQATNFAAHEIYTVAEFWKES